MRKRNKNKIKKNKRRKKKAMQAFLIEFNDIINVIVDKLKNPKDGLPAYRSSGAGGPEGFIVKYEIDNLSFLAQVLTRKLPIKQSIGNEHAKIPEGDIFLIWHGTSLHRAKSILKSGFKSGRFRRYVYFASNIMTSLRYATGRAHAESSEPAIFAAICDPSKLGYSEDFQRQEYYTFQDSIATRIVKYLLTRHGLYSIGEIVTEANNFKDELTDIIVTETKRFRDDLTNITITQNSGNAGIAYWLNSFLDLDDSDGISENHPAVGQIKEWVDEQYANGRIMPIVDEEILILAKRYLSEYFD